MPETVAMDFIYELRRDSYEYNCFVHTKTNESIPIIKINIRGDYIIGVDFLNSIDVMIPINSIDHYDSMYKDHPFKITLDNQYRILRDICRVENLKLDQKLIYKNIPLHEKIISLFFLKEYPEIEVSELKSFWQNKINQNCDKFIEYVDLELNSCTNELYKNELSQIKDNLLTVKLHRELNSFKSKDDICGYWPQIILPAPSFVKLQ